MRGNPEIKIKTLLTDQEQDDLIKMYKEGAFNKKDARLVEFLLNRVDLSPVVLKAPKTLKEVMTFIPSFIELVAEGKLNDKKCSHILKALQMQIDLFANHQSVKLEKMERLEDLEENYLKISEAVKSKGLSPARASEILKVMDAVWEVTDSLNKSESLLAIKQEKVFAIIASEMELEDKMAALMEIIHD